MVLYQQTEVPGKGIGVLATASIPIGTLIIAETPLLTIPSTIPTAQALNSYILAAIARLSGPQRAAFLSLHKVPWAGMTPFHSIVKTNGFGVGDGGTETGVFEICSRFNHSCVPNASFVWNVYSRKMEVRAVEEIEEGEEIFVSYLGGQAHDLFSRDGRRKDLQDRYDFVCQCTVCSLDAAEEAADSALRAEARRLDDEIESGALLSTNPGLALKYCKELVDLKRRLKQTPEISRIYFEALKVCVAHGDLARTKAFARLSIEIKARLVGEWAVEERERGLLERPDGHPLAFKVSKRWRTQAKNARERGSEGFEEWLWSRAVR
jgi:hypothetical protein